MRQRYLRKLAALPRTHRDKILEFAELYGSRPEKLRNVPNPSVNEAEDMLKSFSAELRRQLIMFGNAVFEANGETGLKLREPNFEQMELRILSSFPFINEPPARGYQPGEFITGFGRP